VTGLDCLAAPPPGCRRCTCAPWPIAWAAVQLELLALTQPTWAPASCSDSFALTGFHSSSHTSALLAEFARVADDDDSSLSVNSSPAEKPARGRRQVRGSGAAAQSGRAKQAKAVAAVKSGRNCGLKDVRCSADTEGAATASDPAVWLCSVMQAAAVSCQQPVLLRQACRLLAGAFRAVGAVQGALLYHHMSLGKARLLHVTDTGEEASRVCARTLHDQHRPQCSSASEPLHVCPACNCPAVGASTTQRQLMLAASQLSHNADELAAANTCSSPAAATSQQQSQLLSYAEVLQQAASAAAQACDSTGDASARLEALARAADGVATAWLTRMLQQLPHGTAVCTVSLPDTSRSEQAGGLLLSRVVLDAATSSVAHSLLVQVPGPCAAAR
jgi:hypothetical protein